MLLTCCDNLKFIAPVHVFYTSFSYGKLGHFLTVKIETLHKNKTKAKFNILFPSKVRKLYASSNSDNRIILTLVLKIY